MPLWQGMQMADKDSKRELSGDDGIELPDAGIQSGHNQKQPALHKKSATADLRDPCSEARRLELRALYQDHEPCASDWHKTPPGHTNRECNRQLWRHRYPPTRQFQDLRSERARRERQAARAPKAAVSADWAPQQVEPAQAVQQLQQEITQLRRSVLVNQEHPEVLQQQQQKEQVAKRARLGNLLPGAAKHQALVATTPSSTAPMPFARGEMPSILVSGSGNLINVTVHQAPVTYWAHPVHL
mmetsp:Transcript_8757/g.22015  ORF Transcript_8757/g.22015 Transcript_8757/m.22015 type:complete len:242 (+) Transcript_8757:1-726(+)